MSKTKNEIVTAQTTAIVEAPAPIPQSTLGITANDIIVPKILLMQAISEMVKQRKAFAGEFVHSIDEIKMDSPLEFIVVGYFKEILQYENNKYVKKDSWTHQKEMSMIREETISGVKINKTISHNYSVVLTKDIAEMMPFPMVISFKKTSVKAGKKLGTSLLMLEEFGKAPQVKTFNLVAKEESGDNGSYFVYDVQPGRNSTDIEIAASKRWADRMKTSVVVVDEKDEEASSGAPSGAQEAPKDIKVNSDIKF